MTTDGGFIVTGLTYSFGTGYCAVYLIKTNAHGDTVWTRAYGPSSNWGNSIEQTTDGGYIIAGGAYYDLYLVKTNASGDTVWTKDYGVPYYNEGYSVQQASDGGYVVAGYSEFNVWLIKTDATGDTIWTRTYGGTDDDVGNSVRQTSDGGYIITGYTMSFGGGSLDVYLIKTNAQGDTLWTRTYGGANADEGLSVREMADGGYVIAGYSASFGAGGSDVYLIKTDSLGNVGVAEDGPNPQVVGHKPAATVVRSLLPGAAAFDAMGRRVVNHRSGVLFIRDRSAITKVLLQR
jgi:hypothetical protein